MALTKIGTENIVKSDERIIMSVKQKYWSNLFTNSYKKTILSVCKYVPSTLLKLFKGAN